MKIFILFVTIAFILERNGTFQTITESLADGQPEMNDVQMMEKILFFEKFKPLLDAMTQVYEKSQFINVLGSIALQCYYVVENESNLASFNLILASMLYSVEKKYIEESKIDKVTDRQLYVKEIPLYAGLLEKFFKVVESVHDVYYEISTMSEIIKTAEEFAQAEIRLSDTESSVFNCGEIISIVDKNRNLFLLYFKGIQAVINDVFDNIGDKIASNPKSRLAKRIKPRLTTEINDEIRAMKIEWYSPNYQEEQEDEFDHSESANNSTIAHLENTDNYNSVQRQSSFDFKTISKKLISVTVIVSVLLGFINLIKFVGFNSDKI